MTLMIAPTEFSVRGDSEIDFSTNGVGFLVWSASSGVIDSNGLWRPWNRTHGATVRLFNGSEAVAASGQVVGVFPLKPISQAPRKAGKSVARVDLPSGITYAAARSGTRPAYELSGFERPEVVAELQAFHAWHYPEKEIVFADLQTGQARRFLFDGPVQVSDSGPRRVEWSVPIVAVADTEAPFALTVVVSGLTARLQWLYAGVEDTRFEYRRLGDLDWSVGDWGGARQGEVTLMPGSIYRFRAVARDGGTSQEVVFEVSGGGFGLSFGLSFGGLA
jgi:hypothetical protein